MRMNRQDVIDALEPFGWDLGPAFWKRYDNDPWVYNLANAIVRLAEPTAAPTRPTREQVREAITRPLQLGNTSQAGEDEAATNRIMALLAGEGTAQPDRESTVEIVKAFLMEGKIEGGETEARMHYKAGRIVSALTPVLAAQIERERGTAPQPAELPEHAWPAHAADRRERVWAHAAAGMERGTAPQVPTEADQRIVLDLVAEVGDESGPVICQAYGQVSPMYVCLREAEGEWRSPAEARVLALCSEHGAYALDEGWVRLRVVAADGAPQPVDDEREPTPPESGKPWTGLSDAIEKSRGGPAPRRFGGFA